MATDFWASSHYKRWITDRATVKQARAEDRAYLDPTEDIEILDYFAIYFADAISKLGRRLQLRQRVIATATVFFHRFYLKNSYCETDPFTVIAACVYLAAKAEESPVHGKNVLSECRSLFSQEHYNVKYFPSDNAKLAEMEFYLVDELECDLTVFHPYRTLLALCKSESSGNDSQALRDDAEAGEVGVGISAEQGPRYWGTGEGQLELPGGALQTAWFIINDTYRSSLCLIHPPHLIAIAAIYLTLILHPTTRATVTALLQTTKSSSPQPASASSTEQQQQTQTPHMITRRSSRQSGETKKPSPQDPITFFASLNVSLSLIATLAQEIISLYTLWDRYKEDETASSTTPLSLSLKRDREDTSPASTIDTPGRRSAASTTATPITEGPPADLPTASISGTGIVTPMYLSALLARMREKKIVDVSQPQTSTGNNNGGGNSGGGKQVVNRLLERTQAAG